MSTRFFIKTYSDHVKQVIKDVLGVKDGDFSGNGIGVTPVLDVGFKNLKCVEFTEADIDNGVTVKMFNGLKNVVALFLYQANTETNAKNFTVSAENLGGESYVTQLSLGNDSESSVIKSGNEGVDWELASDNINMGSYGGYLFLKDLRVSQDSADGTAQDIRIKCWYME